jgi:hypothetical protein
MTNARTGLASPSAVGSQASATAAFAVSSFGLRHFFVIRHQVFVIFPGR